MIFAGNSEQLKIWLDTLLIIFGQDAKVSDLKNISLICMRRMV